MAGRAAGSTLRQAADEHGLATKVVRWRSSWMMTWQMLLTWHQLAQQDASLAVAAMLTRRRRTSAGSGHAVQCPWVAMQTWWRSRSPSRSSRSFQMDGRPREPDVHALRRAPALCSWRSLASLHRFSLGVQPEHALAHLHTHTHTVRTVRSQPPTPPHPTHHHRCACTLILNRPTHTQTMRAHTMHTLSPGAPRRCCCQAAHILSHPASRLLLGRAILSACPYLAGRRLWGRLPMPWHRASAMPSRLPCLACHCSALTLAWLHKSVSHVTACPLHSLPCLCY